MRNINYKLIVSDFDGTLVNHNTEITDENKKAISEYIENGGIFAISTGRLPASILPQARKLGLKGLLCCCNGTIIIDIESGDVVFEKRLSKETTLMVCRTMEEMGLHVLAFDLWDYYTNKDDERLKHYESVAKTTATPITDRKLSDFLEEKQMEAYKLVTVVDPKDNERILSMLQAKNLPGCEITKSIDFLIEIVNNKYSKGTAISYLADKYGIQIEKTIAIGDNFNDMPMILSAGMGIAVANAENSLKDEADYVCEFTNEESAVAKIIEKFGFLSK